jgi:hypothetical protein
MKVLPTLVIGSVITRNFLGDARALVRTLRRWHPEARVYVLVVDGVGGAFVPEEEDFIVVELSELGLGEPLAYCFQYTAFELCNALKAPLLQHLLTARGEPAALYLDADQGVYARLDALWEEVLSRDILLVPHLLVTMPRDGRFPSEAALLASGVYNAGALGVRAQPEGLRFLQWWSAHVRHDCVADPRSGLFVDQKFLDLVPALFPSAGILRHDGVNVAHFNLHHRRLHCRDGEWWVNDVRLLLFHFTQVTPEDGHFWPRVSRDFTAQQSALDQLLGSYRQDRLAVGQPAIRLWPYGFANFASGRPISPGTRVGFRAGWKAGAPPGNPFSSAHWEAYERRILRQHRWHRLGRWLVRLGRRLRLLGPPSDR